MCQLGSVVKKRYLTPTVAWKVFRIHPNRGDDIETMYRSLYRLIYTRYKKGLWYKATYLNRNELKRVDVNALSGFWSFKTRRQAREYRRQNVCSSRFWVVCKVLITGEAVEYSGGYRSQCMQIMDTGQ